MDVKGKAITVVGMGLTSIALVKLLLREGAHPFVTEAGPAGKAEPFRKQLDGLGVPYECGGHTGAAFREAAVVIPSPGVPPGLPPIVRAVESGASLMGEMEFAFPYCCPRILAVTGTNGKTTTTELLRTLMASCGHAVLLAGNNEFPFSAAVMADPAPEYIVLEVSSYQLETARLFRPWIGVVLNLTPDHLERHGNLDTYAAVKAGMFANQGPGDVAVVNHDDPRVRGMAAGTRASVWPFSIETRVEAGLWLDGEDIRLGDSVLASVSDLRLPGRHNLQNTLAALSVMRAGGFDWPKTIEGLRGFRGVEHRIELTASADGVDFYNDSKSTNADSLKAALESFSRPVVLIAGGRGKGAGYSVLRGLVGNRVKAMVAMGEDAPKLEEAFGDLTSVTRASGMKEAVAAAAKAARPGDIVLLSPACASLDMFDDFEHRGRVYKECVADCLAEEETAE